MLQFEDTQGHVIFVEPFQIAAVRERRNTRGENHCAIWLSGNRIALIVMDTEPRTVQARIEEAKRRPLLSLMDVAQEPAQPRPGVYDKAAKLWGRYDPHAAQDGPEAA